MNASNNRRNHDFQILHFLVGSCHTVDGAYALLCDLKEEREMALANANAQAKRVQAKEIRARRALESRDEAERLEAQAMLMEIKDGLELTKRCFAAAEAELVFIGKCMSALEPYRKHTDLPLAQAHEAAQREEWGLELAQRAENFMLTSGTIPADELKTMRMHPDFVQTVLPVITRLRDPEEREKALLVPREVFPKLTQLTKLLKEDE